MAATVTSMMDHWIGGRLGAADRGAEPDNGEVLAAVLEEFLEVKSIQR